MSFDAAINFTALEDTYITRGSALSESTRPRPLFVWVKSYKMHKKGHIPIE